MHVYYIEITSLSLSTYHIILLKKGELKIRIKVIIENVKDNVK